MGMPGYTRLLGYTTPYGDEQIHIQDSCDKHDDTFHPETSVRSPELHCCGPLVHKAWAERNQERKLLSRPLPGTSSTRIDSSLQQLPGAIGFAAEFAFVHFRIPGNKHEAP
jgi:hypothetical protein